MNIATDFPKETRRLRLILALTLLALGAGLVAPIITLKKFMLVENTFSVLGGVVELLQAGQVFLFIIITGFSIALPLLKILMLGKLLSPHAQDPEKLDKYLHWMHVYGKWSMLDVFVVAVLVVAVKLGAIASVEMRFGLYLFAAAVLLTMYVTARVVHLTNASGDQAH
ncbi:MAG: paraquat-inducible protein A [Pseudomonadota bacterium]